MQNKLWYLKHCELFARLAPEQLQRIESSSRLRSFRAGEPVYLPSEKAESVFLLADGLVKVCHLTSDGKESILAFIEPGELFGESAIFDDQDREEYVESVKASSVVMVPLVELERLMNTSTDVALGITKLVGLRRRRIERRLKHVLFLSNHDRLVNLLLDLAEQFGWRSEEGIQLRIKLSHQELANLIGSTRETVTVILNQLKTAGSVEIGRRKLLLKDPEQLAKSVTRQLAPL